MPVSVNRIVVVIMLMFACFINSSAQTPVEKYGQLSVRGNRIVDKNGNPVQLRGMSLYWSQWKPAFYNASCVKWLRDDWCVSVVRAAMAVSSGGLATSANEKQKIFTVIDACIANGIYVIVDYHDHTANTSIDLAKSFFSEVSLKYKDVPNIIYEPWNEPLQVSWTSVIKPYHQAIVDVIRRNDPDNIIICGTANWSQKVEDPANDPVVGRNIAYTLHYYAASHKQWLRDAATRAMNKGIALFVTEYGTCEASGNGVLDAAESKLWWDFLQQNFIGHCNWSCADLGETSAALKTGTSATGNWPASALKPSGILVRDYLRSKCNTISDPLPLVNITAPANAGSVCSGTAVNISANASVSNGSISKVDFYDGTTLLYTDNSSPYSYTWNNASVGTHTIKAISTNSANVASTPASITFTVNSSTLVIPYIQLDGVNWLQQNSTQICVGNKIVLGPHPLTATGWVWTGPNNFTAAVREVTLSNINSAQAGVYTATYTNENGCKSTSNVSVAVNALPAAPSVSTPVTYCQNVTASALTANGSGLKWYATATGGTVLSGAPTPITTIAGTTNYYVSQTTNSCESSRAQIAVTVNALPTATITAGGSTTFCQGSAVTLTASAGSSYVWKNGSTVVGTNQTYNATTSGSYSVEVSNGSNCKASSAPTVVTVHASPTATIISAGPTTFCQGSAVTLTAYAGSSYIWKNGSIVVGTNQTYNATTSGSYSVEVSNGSNCKATSAPTVVTVNASPTTTIIAAGPTTFCQGSAVTFTASAGSSYLWKNGSIVVGTNQTYNATTSGSYSVEVSNGSNCKATSAPTVVTVNSTTTWYADMDGDGTGNAAVTQFSCSKPSGYVLTAGDECPADANKIAAGNCGCGNTESSCVDCAGISNGTASMDVCNRCSGGTTGITPVTHAAACTTTAVVDLTSTDAIKILPNPSSSEFTLLLTNSSTIQVLSADGKLVEAFYDVKNLNFGGAYAKGVYILQIHNDNTIHVLRVIKL